MGDLVGIIAACEYTFAGREIYIVTFDCAERPVRTVLGDYLSLDHAPAARQRRASVLPTAFRQSPKLHPLEIAA
ncbi:hypothetical protein [Aminobacter sp. MSH1]|nr:hypothetical protein [Aminobacter sp. MSH1]